MTPDSRLRIVLKFGGTSVSTRKGWETIATLVRGRSTEQRLLIVHSALAKVTDALERLPDEAMGGKHGPTLDALEERHFLLCTELDLEGPSLLAADLTELREQIDGIALLGEVTRHASRGSRR
jgi:diaminopimelate decarboxylase/aspartate kinase